MDGWESVFENYGIKQVAPNDKRKGAYVPNAEQRAAIEAAGILPKQGVGFSLLVLEGVATATLDTSYYYSTRSAVANRAPEPRMGRAFISKWLNPGDYVLIGNIGSQVFAIRLVAASASPAITAALAEKAKSEILKRAKAAKGKPKKKSVQREEFVRDPVVVAGALIRADGSCEMPGCKCSLFQRDNGTNYLEVHHVTPLSENGVDEFENVAALCPHCHRFLHHGKGRSRLRKELAIAIASISV